MKTHPYLWSKQSGLSQTYPLLAHLLDTATFAGVLYDFWLRPGLRNLLKEELGDQAKLIVQWIAGSHDIGKASPTFQEQPRRHGHEWDEIRTRIRNQESFSFLEPHFARRLADNQITFLTRHEQVSSFTISNQKLLSPNNRASIFWAALPSLGHHGTFTFPDRGKDTLARRIEQSMEGWSQAQLDLLDVLSEATSISQERFPKEVSSTVIILLSGLTILADRIASDTNWVAENQELLNQDKLSLDSSTTWIDRCADRALQRVKSTLGIYQNWADKDAALAAILGEYQPRPLQQEALKTQGGIWNAMAPTGNGKTEAALLRHSLENERLIFLLPTQATTNALMRRIQKAYAKTSNVASLAHGLSSIENFYSRPVTVFSDTCTGKDSGGLYPTEFVKSGASRLLAPVCVGTIDQSLMASIPMKWTHLRLLALANSHIVIDEIHTLDHYQSELLVPLLNWLGLTKTRVTFLSATFPQWQRDRFISAYTNTNLTDEISFPSTESIDTKDFHVRKNLFKAPQYTINFTLSESKFSDLEKTHLQWALDKRKQFPKARLGIICNTVQRAQTIARHLAECGEPVILLHSRMTAKHRALSSELLEKRIGAGGTGVALTVVGTQAIEASLDIDLDLLSTDLCPAPSLIQRAGRVWRREDPQRTNRIPNILNLTIQVVRPKDADTWMLKPYFEAELTRTWNFLQENPNFQCPDLNQDFVDSSAITLENILTSADLDQFAENADALRKGKDKSKMLTEVLKPHSKISDFEAITNKDFTDSDSSNFTRLIHNEIRQVIVGGNPEHIPGAWNGTVQDLISFTAQDQKNIQRALQASLPITITNNNREHLNTILVPLYDAKTLLKRYYFLPSKFSQNYDPLLGFIGVSDQ